MKALEPGTLYTFSVWAERNNVTSSKQSLHVSTGEMGLLLPVEGLRSDLGGSEGCVDYKSHQAMGVMTS